MTALPNFNSRVLKVPTEYEFLISIKKLLYAISFVCFLSYEIMDQSLKRTRMK